MEKKLTAMVLAIAMMWTIEPVSCAEVPFENGEELPTFCCGTDPSTMEEMYEALLQNKMIELQCEMSIAPFSVMPDHKFTRLMPSTGTVNMVVIPISYSDYPRYKESFDLEYTYNEFFAPYNSTADAMDQSVRGFYQWSSYEALNIEGTVLELYEAPNPSTYYYTNGLPYEKRKELIEDAINYYVGQGVDFSKYDNDGDGVLDAVYIKSLRPYNINYTSQYIPMEVCGYKYGSFVFSSLPIYSGSGREDFESARKVAEHEIGHLMGLPDNYLAHGTENNLDLNLYELMQGATGCSRYINAYYKYLLGWDEPLILTEMDKLTCVDLAPVEPYTSTVPNAPRAVVIIPNAELFPFTEFFFMEYRQGGLYQYMGPLPIYDHTPGIVLWHANTFLDSNLHYQNEASFLKPVYKSGSEPYGEKDIYVKGDEFNPDTEPSSNFSDGSKTGISMRVDSITAEKATLTVGFDGELLPGPEIEVSPPSKPVIRKGETATFTVTVKLGDELMSPDLIGPYDLMDCSTSGNVTNAGMVGSPLRNPRTITIPGYPHTNPESYDGTIWLDIPAGAIRYNNKDSNAVVSKKLYIDNTPPGITLKGDDPQRIQKGSPYVELGAVVTDNLDPEIKNKLQIDATRVNPDVPGTYEVAYSVTDHAGHTTTKTRAVIVEEGPPAHEHHFSDAWESDGTGHWHVCGCGVVSESAAHIPEPVPGQGATCTQPGKTEGSYCSVCSRVLAEQEDIPLKPHSYTAEWKHDGSNHWQECANCGGRGNTAAHTVEVDPAEDATCTAPGKTRGSHCSICGTVLQAQTTLQPTGHSPATAWSSDTAGHWQECTKCHEETGRAVHTENAGVVTKPATEEEAGIKTYSCSICGYEMRTESIPKLEPSHTHEYATGWAGNEAEHWHECGCGDRSDIASHTPEPVPGQAASCTQPGKTEGSRCSVCKRTLTEQKEIPKKAHEISDEWHYGTIYEDGMGHWRECINCQTMFDLELHQEDNGTVTREPTEKEAGVRMYACSVCGYAMRTEEIPKLKPSHTHSYPEEWSHDGANHWRECSSCHEKAEQAVHVWNSGVVTTVPTSSKAGVRTYTCTVCKRTRTESVPVTGGGSSGGGGGSGGYVPQETEYTITLPKKSEGGGVKAEPLKAKKGSTVTLTVEPAEGYELEKIQVTDKKGKDIVLEEKEGKYTFSMPASHVEVGVAFRELPKVEVTPPPQEEPVVLPFTDVPKTAWYYDAVAEIYSKGIMTGLSETQFAPELPASRGMVVTMLYRMEGEPAAKESMKFTDVPGNQYYAPAVAWAVETGIVKGYEDGSFRPDEGITREQLVTLLYRYAEWKGQDVSGRADLSRFFDAKQISPYARESMAWARAEGLLNGADWGGIDPGGGARRGQIAAVLVRFVQ